MSTLILLLAVVALTPLLAWQARLALIRQRRNWARREFQRRLDAMARGIEELAVVIGQTLLPVIQQVATAFNAMAAVLMKDPTLAALARAANRQDAPGED